MGRKKTTKHHKGPMRFHTSGFPFYDFKRKIKWETLKPVPIFLDDNPLDMAYFETCPFASIEEFQMWFGVWQTKFNKRRLVTFSEFQELKGYIDETELPC